MPDVVGGVVAAQHARPVQLPARRRRDVHVLFPVGVEGEGDEGEHHPDGEVEPGGGGGGGGSPGAGGRPLAPHQLHGEVEKDIYEPAGVRGRAHMLVITRRRMWVEE